MRPLILLLLPFAFLFQNEAIEVDRVETTPTQAVIAFTVAEPGSCTVEIAFDSGFTRPSHDTDENLFPGSQKCGRPGAIIDGKKVVFVAGLRRAMKAADGRFYSRALETNRRYYYRIRSGEHVKEGSFETANIPLGKLYGEPYPFDAEAPGHYAWPSIDWKDSAREYIDPLTGIVVKRLSGPQMAGAEISRPTPGTAAFDGGQGAWTGTEQAAAIDGRAAHYSGSSREPVFIRAPEYCPGGYGCDRAVRWEQPYRSLDDVEVSLKVWCASEGCRSNANGERNVDICLSVDGASCATDWKTVEAGTSGSGRAAVFPSRFPSPMFSEWLGGSFHEPIARPFVATYTGRVNVNGTEVTLAGGNSFAVGAWGTNSRIRIGDNEYLIQSVNSATSITLYESAGEASNVPYSARNFGVLVRKSTESADLLELDGVEFRTANSHEFEMGSSGAWDFCAPTKVTDAAGKEGFLCRVNTAESYPTIWFVGEDGESRFLGIISAPYNVAIDGNPADGSNAGCLRGLALNPSNPNEFYCITQSNATPSAGLLILRGTYLPEGRPGCNQPAGYRAIAGGDACNIRWELVTRPSRNQSLLAKAHAFDPAFDPQRYPFLSLFSMQGGLLGFAAWAGQDTMAWSIWVDGNSFEIVSMQDYHSKAPCRFCAVHSFLQMGNAEYNAVVVKDFVGGTTTNAGPYEVTVTATGSSSDGALALNSAEVCPADASENFRAAGATGVRCVTITLAGEPCDSSPSQWEKQNLPACSWQPGAVAGQAIQEGDEAGHGPERFLFVKKLDANRWVVLRNYNIPHGPILKERSSNAGAHTAGWKLQMVCSAATVSGYVWVNFPQDRHGTSMVRDNALSRAQHGDISELGSIINDYDVVANQLGRFLWYQPIPGRFGIAAEHKVLNGEGFGNVPVHRFPVYNEYLQTHPSWRQVSAPEKEKRWYLDGNPFAPGSGGNYRLWPQQVTPVAGSLYKLGPLASPLTRKILPTIAWAGTRLLRDVSGPGSRIGGENEDAWKYCVADFADECVEGSTSGAVYVNVPGMTRDGFCGESGRVRRPCFTSMVNAGIGIAQYGSENHGSFRPDRFLTAQMQRYNLTWTYDNAVPVPDGTWAIASGSWLEGARSDILLMKLPPYPEPDQVDRGNFVPVAVPVTAREGAVRARIRFGYAENGPPDRYFCTSREEACLSGTRPFVWAGEQARGEACEGGCSIPIPGISGRVVYYSVEWLNGSGEVVHSGARSAAVVP